MGNILLDLVISNSPDSILSLHVCHVPLLSSDHFLISFFVRVVTCNHSLPRPCPSSFRDYTSADYEGMCDYLLDWDFSECLASSDVEFIWAQVKFAIYSAIELFVPLVSCPRSYSHLLKWFNSDLRHKLKCVKTLRRRYNSHPTSHVFGRLSDLESRLMAGISSAKSDFESQLVSNCAITSNFRIFSYIRSMSHQNQFPPTMFLDSSSASSDIDKAELFNRYFYSIYSSWSEDLPSLSSLPPRSDQLATLSDIHVCLSEVCSLFPHLHLKATGVDGIGPRILKSCSCALSEPLFYLFQVSLLSAQLPSEWTIHRISPVFKSGERISLVSNYRPVSLLCSVSKVLECLVYDKVVDFLSDSISLSQFGFQRGKFRSC